MKLIAIAILVAMHLPSSSLLPLAALLALLGMSPAAAAPVRPCSDACFEAARGAYRECASSASGAFVDATGSCVERTLECVDACRSRRQACRDGTGAGAELAGCLVELATAKGQCPNEFPPGSIRRALCFHRAELAGLRCRSGVRRRLRTALRDCRAGFGECVSTCGPGEPPGGVVTCRAEGKAAFRAVRAGCRRTLQVTASGCLEKVVTCVPDCADARDACSAPTRATLAAALVTCTAQERAGVAACQAANPGAGPALEQCTIVAQANASTCRDAAVEAAGPGIAVCAQQYVRCIRACPPA